MKIIDRLLNVGSKVVTVESSISSLLLKSSKAFDKETIKIVLKRKDTTDIVVTDTVEIKEFLEGMSEGKGTFLNVAELGMGLISLSGSVKDAVKLDDTVFKLEITLDALVADGRTYDVVGVPAFNEVRHIVSYTNKTMREAQTEVTVGSTQFLVFPTNVDLDVVLVNKAGRTTEFAKSDLLDLAKINGDVKTVGDIAITTVVAGAEGTGTVNISGAYSNQGNVIVVCAGLKKVIVKSAIDTVYKMFKMAKY